MKLAEALSQRAELNRRMAQLAERIKENARIQEGDAPNEDPVGLLAEFDVCVKEFERLINRINTTNLETKLADGRTMTEALARRDALKIKVAVYRTVADKASGTNARVTRSEVKFLPAVRIPDLRKVADEGSRELRELDTQIQEANWQNNLIE